MNPPKYPNQIPSTASQLAPLAPAPNAQAPQQLQSTPPIVQSTGIIASTPSFAPVANLQRGEVTNQANPQEDIIVLNVIRSLLNRKLYLWIFGVQTDNAYALCHVKFWNNSAVVSVMEHELAYVSNTALNRNYLSTFANGGNSANDSMLLIVGLPVVADTQPASVVLQPMRFTGEIDKITLSVKEMKNTTYVRAFMACLSNS